MKTLILAMSLCLGFTIAKAQTSARKSIIATKKVMMRHQDWSDSLLIPVVSPQYPALRDSLNEKNLLFGDSLADVVKHFETEGGGITSLSFDVTFESRGLISLKIYYETMGTYPDSYTRYLTLSTATGRTYPITREINNVGLNCIFSTYKANLKKSVATDKAYRKKHDEEYKKEPESYNRLYHNLLKSIDQLKLEDMFAAYVLTAEGITFTTAPAMPHVARDLEPARDWLIPYKKLKAFKKPEAIILK